MSDLKPDTILGHPGEKELRQRYGSDARLDDFTLRDRIEPFVAGKLAIFVEAQPFFFIATSNAQGHCDASFRGTERGADGAMLPAVKLVNPRRLIFPDYPGNGFFNSLGNILENPHIGLLFINFEFQRRVRINGTAQLIEADDAARALWPRARAVVQVDVEQCYDNCAARIPRMVTVPR
ncbi:MAG: pyridoxamine 5'-phosphate oxidase family protein [Proteobacteria bacterium]|nr:pyridoxamine 5'-phosphate oxidase family protein [Pseudomonadota bacterium]